MNTKKHLVVALKKAKLPHAYTTLISYEKKGIIPKSKNPIDYGRLKWRSYTDEEIVDIVNCVREYVTYQKYKKGKV